MSGITPQRKIRAIFDIDDYAQGQGIWGSWRWFDKVAPLAAKARGGASPFASKVWLWSNGCWTLAPKQFDLGTWGVTDPGVILTPGSTLTTVNKTDHTMSANRLYDVFWRKKDTNGGNHASLSAPTKVTSFNTALAAIVNLRPLAKSVSSLAANQGFCLRFKPDGIGTDTHDWIGAVIFGQYGLAFRGDGIAEIWEYGTPAGAGSATWKRHERLRFAREGGVNNRAHRITVLPMIGVSGEKWILINGCQLDTNEQGTTGLAATPGGTGAQSGSVSFGEFPFRWQEGRTKIPDQSGGPDYVTTSAQLWLMEREDLRCLWQVSRIKYEASGQLLSDIHAAEIVDTRTFSLSYIGRSITGYTLTSTFKDSSGTTILGSSGEEAFYVQWDMASTDGLSTPLLWAYKVTKDATQTLLQPGSFTVSEKISGGTVDGSGAASFLIGPFGSDPRLETASFHVEDLADNWPRLRARSKLAFKLVTKADDGTTDVTLFRGYARPHRTRKGHANRTRGGFHAGASAAYPSSEWSSYQIEAAGMWERLSTVTLRTALAFENFGYDTLSATGQVLGWKVTDAIKHLLTVAGFPASMQNIPVSGIRLNPGIAVGDSDRILEPSTSIAEMIVRLARNYLGRYLVFDANQGTYGKWTLVGAPTSTTPLATFVGGHLTPSGSTKQVGHVGSYSGSYPVLSRVESYFVAPECNHLWTFSLVDAFNTGGYRVDNHLYNYLSYKVPGSTTDPDPESPHYCPEGEKLFVLADPTLWAGGSATWQGTQAAVDFCVTRLFFYLCIAREVTTFEAPLALITDPAGHKRPLRHYDPVSWNGGTWYVRSMQAKIAHGHMQLADYELERLVEYKPNP